MRALVDKYEDPADVYRIVFPPHARVRVTLKPRFGNPDLAAFTRTATSTGDDEQLIGRSRRKGKKRDTLTLRNPSKRKRSAYLVVYVDREDAHAGLALRAPGPAREALARVVDLLQPVDRGVEAFHPRLQLQREVERVVA